MITVATAALRWFKQILITAAKPKIANATVGSYDTIFRGNSYNVNILFSHVQWKL
jgi:hypothetical protein